MALHLSPTSTITTTTTTHTPRTHSPTHIYTHNHTLPIALYFWHACILTLVRSIVSVYIIHSWAQKYAVFCFVFYIFITNTFSNFSALSRSPLNILLMLLLEPWLVFTGSVASCACHTPAVLGSPLALTWRIPFTPVSHRISCFPGPHLPFICLLSLWRSTSSSTFLRKDVDS